jgi:hypothetical protein
VGLYLDPELSRLKSEPTVASSFDRHLRAAIYLCPKCEEFALRFRATIIVD